MLKYKETRESNIANVINQFLDQCVVIHTTASDILM